MSRTDVHAPDWVKERDPRWRAHFIDSHDHSHGECDIEEFYQNPHARWGTTHCYISYNSYKNISCGCNTCTGRFDNAFAKRRIRTRLRKVLRDLKYDPEMNVPAFDRKLWW